MARSVPARLDVGDCTARQVCWAADSEQAQSRVAWAPAVPSDRCDLDYTVVAWPGVAVISSLPAHALLPIVLCASELAVPDTPGCICAAAPGDRPAGDHGCVARAGEAAVPPRQARRRSQVVLLGKRPALSFRAAYGCTDLTHRGSRCSAHRARLPQTRRGEARPRLDVVPQIVLWGKGDRASCRSSVGCHRLREGHNSAISGSHDQAVDPTTATVAKEWPAELLTEQRSAAEAIAGWEPAPRWKRSSGLTSAATRNRPRGGALRGVPPHA